MMDETLMNNLFEQSLRIMAEKHNLNQSEINEIREENTELKNNLKPEFYAGVFIIMMIEQAASAYATKDFQ